MATAIGRDEVQRLVREGVLLVDALPPEDYEQEHLPGAVSIPLKQIDAARVRELDRHAPLIVYCNDYQ